MLAAGGKNEPRLYDPAVQALPAERLNADSREAVRGLLTRMRRSPGTFYADRTGSDLPSLPITTAAGLAAEVAAHPPFGRLQAEPEPLIRTALATAGLPHPTPIAWSRSDLDCEAGLGARALWRAGLRPRGRSSDCLDGGLITPNTLAVTDALDVLDALAVPVGPIANETALQRAREVWNIVQPEVLIVDAKSLAFLQRSSEVNARPCMVVLLTVDETDQLSRSPSAQVCRILSLPQVSTFLAGECIARDGYHVAEDAVAVEVVEPASFAPLPTGATGRLLVTTLKRSLALVRFDTGLQASIDRRPCGCGETHARLRFA